MLGFIIIFALIGFIRLLESLVGAFWIRECLSVLVCLFLAVSFLGVKFLVLVVLLEMTFLLACLLV
jgi:hypothetical protein